MKVLIPVDGSQPSEETLNWASQFFNPSSTQFYLLTVVSKTVPELPTEEYEIEDALKILNTGKAILESKGMTVVKAEYIIGDPAPVICEYANELQVDQIVLGSHGHSALKRVLLGTVSSRVFEHAKQPVFIYKNLTQLSTSTPL